MKPTWQQEKSLRSKGYNMIVGLDEAGRGAWAGPIVAAAVVLPFGIKIDDVRDSKLLTPKKREKVFLNIIKQAIAWSVGIVGQSTIDDLGISFSNHLAMHKAIEVLPQTPDYLLIDAVKLQHRVPRTAIIKGDRKVISIAAASIIAKVIRDQIMIQKHREYPQYNFHRHKGYGTKSHLANLKKYGVSDFHRASYRPVRMCID